jgi:hypothetical protein
VKGNKVYFFKTAFLLAALALAGCGAVKKDEDASVIKEKSVERWNLLIAHQAEKAYDFLSPGYRQTKDRAAYAKEMNGRPVRWTKVHYTSQDCDADTCTVHLTVDYTVNMGGPVGSVSSSGFVVETWIKTDGRWWHLPSQLGPSTLGKEPKGKDS